MKKDKYQKEISELSEKIKKNSSIVIYGAKIVAYGVYEALKTVYEIIPECFVVTDKNEEIYQDIDGVPVIGIDEFNKDKNILIFVATPEIYHEEIMITLNKKKYGNIIFVDTHIEYLLMSGYHRKVGKFKLLEDMCVERDELDVDTDSVKMYMAKCHVDRNLKGQYDIPEWVVPIQVGAQLTDQIISDIRDDMGDNISTKNKNYSELTATYWVWKNCTAKYKGICHYRRNICVDKYELKVLLKGEVNVILPLPFVCYTDTSNQYGRYIKEEDMQALFKALDECYPEYGRVALDILNGRYIYNYNMLLADANTFDEYAKWLFTVLYKVEEICEPKGCVRSDRYIGYLGEVLTSIFFMHNKDKLKIAHGEKVWMI